MAPPARWPNTWSNVFYRDVRLLRIYGGTWQIQQTIIAKAMVRQAAAN